MNRKLAALSVVLLSGCLLSFQAQAQTSCSNASLNGTYFYLVNGPASITASGSSPYAELGEFVADGNGGVSSGQSVGSLKGSITPWTFTGSYAVGEGRGVEYNLRSATRANEEASPRKAGLLLSRP